MVPKPPPPHPDPFDALWNSINSWIAASFLVPLALFVFLYLRRTEWNYNRLGEALLIQKIAFGLIFVNAVFTNFFPLFQFRQPIRATFFVIVGITLWVDVKNLRWFQKHFPFSWKDRPRPNVWKVIRRYFSMRGD